MKFTKEQAFESLKGILTNNGKKTLRMSERSIETQLEDLIPLVANDEMELAEFVQKVQKYFDTMNSNMEKDRSDFIKQWEEDHETDAKRKKDKKDDAAEENVEVKALMERIGALEAAQAETKRVTAISAKKNQLIEKMKEKGIRDKEWIEMMLSETSVNEDTDVESKVESLLKIYNRQKADTTDFETPGSPSGSGQRKDLFASVLELKKKKDEQEKSII